MKLSLNWLDVDKRWEKMICSKNSPDDDSRDVRKQEE